MDLLRNLNHLESAPALVRLQARAVLLIFMVVAANAALGQPLVQPPPAVAVEQVDDPGFFEVRSAVAELRNGVYHLNARVGYRLPTDALQALHSGVPLGFRLDIEIIHPRRWWFDNEGAALQQVYQLEYHALSERYIVQNSNSGEQESFASLLPALEYLGRIDRLPLIDAAVLDDDRGYYARVRASLDQEQFPGPLRLLAFWRRDWAIASEWYRWPLRSE